MSRWADITRATNAQILAWAEARPWSRAMADCRQDAQWHAEGDVWTHTRMVCAELERLADWPSLDRAGQLKLLFTALFHDAGKPATTVVDPETGRTRSPKHALVGAEIARRVLRELECDIVTHEDCRCTVTLMSGVPGAGKDTWLARHRPGLPVVSLDAVRVELDVDATDNQGGVIQLAREHCREHLRAGRDFAFNATNLTRLLRRRWIDLFADYGARIEIVYLEPPLETALQRNRRRPEPVPDKVIYRLLKKLEPPTIAECHHLHLAGEQAHDH